MAIITTATNIQLKYIPVISYISASSGRSKLALPFVAQKFAPHVL